MAMTREQKRSRRDQILQALALMLEQGRGQRITTAALAREVGVSEAALYRHFPSKARMYEALIEYIEQTLFERVTLIINEPGDVSTRCQRILTLLLVFAEKNPGLCRIMTGEALTGEHERLQTRMTQLYERLETQLKQVLRTGEIEQGYRPVIGVSALANLLMATAEGRVNQYVRSGFRHSPQTYWDDQWQLLSTHLAQPE
ncbi:nucleoid occlusion factor SlmA [Kushneria pakistanensis]|uniref:Nucleoid occlusion factor SlmA n=2 Tax=Kushneria pakistanensis TaxID=1508770 RepID=A0ABQ3FL07_9GAMM|nr:nucleoid occlusion factor SlmA [Kushneria pakistanensis]